MRPRVDHWERLLAAAIDRARVRPFIWGLHDCPTFAFETRMILTGGEDVAALARPLSLLGAGMLCSPIAASDLASAPEPVLSAWCPRAS